MANNDSKVLCCNEILFLTPSTETVVDAHYNINKYLLLLR